MLHWLAKIYVSNSGFVHLLVKKIERLYAFTLVKKTCSSDKFLDFKQRTENYV